jgi:hypothetical protein
MESMYFTLVDNTFLGFPFEVAGAGLPFFTASLHEINSKLIIELIIIFTA